MLTENTEMLMSNYLLIWIEDFLSWMVERVNYGDAKCASLSYKKLFVYVKQWKN